jgi:hypothetical protein
MQIVLLHPAENGKKRRRALPRGRLCISLPFLTTNLTNENVNFKFGVCQPYVTGYKHFAKSTDTGKGEGSHEL